MSILEIGCCGAYCRTCREYTKGLCKGCKLGYDTGERDINRAKCRMKVCCFSDKGMQTCADCSDLDTCEIILNWVNKGYKYKRYKKTLDFIKENGYEKFLEVADQWNDSVGKI